MQDRLLQTLDLLDTPIAVLDVADSGRITYRWCNAANTRMTGFPPEAIAGRTVEEVLQGRAGTRIAERHRQVAATGKPARYDMPVQFPSGQVWMRINLSPVTDAGGRVVQLTAEAVDISAAKRAAERRARAEFEMDALRREMSVFLTRSAQDLTTPVYRIRSLCRQLREGFRDLGDGKAQLIDDLEDVTTGSLELMMELMERTDQARPLDETETVDFGELCADLLILLDPGSRVDSACTAEWIETDRIALEAVLGGLMTEFLPADGTPPGRLRLSVIGTGSGTLDFIVSDDRPGGIDVAPLQGLEPDPAQRVADGTGLARVRKIVRARGGAIWIAEPELGGTSIRFSLPGRLLHFLNQSAG